MLSQSFQSAVNTPLTLKLDKKIVGTVIIIIMMMILIIIVIIIIIKYNNLPND